MHWYKRNLGDYAKKAGRLTMLQHGAYTLLIDACYDREKFPTLDEAYDWCWASTQEEKEAIEFVLNKFFSIDENGVFMQNRIAEEIQNYHEKADQNKRIAIEREAKRKEKNTNRVHNVNESPPNQQPVTNNQQPVTKDKPNKPLTPLQGFDEFYKSYPVKKSKPQAVKAWNKLNPDEVLINEIMEKLEKQKQSTDWQKDNGKFIPHPSTYLNNRRWEDEIIIHKKSFNEMSASELANHWG